MTAQSGRARQMADRIRVIVAETLERRIKDPRLGFVTITDVRITGDLHDATLFYTVLGSDEQRNETAAALESAKGVLRSEVGRLTGVRFTPTLTFMADVVPEHAQHIEDLLRDVRSADERVAATRVGATYAGEPDPYRVPRSDDDDQDDLDPKV
jgi:ribosome-binding factor A